jgi:ABC-type branched-subunit amino acid transport system ATPase component
MDLEPFRTSFVRELSTGTRRILDLACQIAHRPTVILLDEPSSGIAQREVEALAPVLVRLRDEMGAALVVIEHDIPLVTEISDRLVALDMGRVIASGDPTHVIAHPQVVESYLGTSSAAISRSGTRG